MGKKIRKTRWRALTIADEQSDSEGSNTSTSVPRIPKSYHHQKSYYNFTYSSQSTPRRRFQHDSSTKSTRSSSTASENKITFNEDEYTRITTPRQDVLFKKGYLNKPKNYQTQNSTGTSTSTGNSTGNGTPDHQSTDLEYESQFVFPNAFVDQNGIYYVNSYDSYPLFLYNPSACFPDYSNVKSKRYSTGSLTESMSPNNEEVTSQDLSQSGGEASNNVSDYNNGTVYNMMCSGYYVNGVCPQEVVNAQCSVEPRKIKKRRRRKVSKSTNQQGDDTSEFTDENESSDEVFNATKPTENRVPAAVQILEIKEPPTNTTNEHSLTETAADKSVEVAEHVVNGTEEPESDQPVKTQLKPDAEEFVPRAYRQETVQFVKIPPNFVPVSIINPIGEYNGQNFNHAFIPPGIPLNFIPQDPKLFQNFYGFMPNGNQTVAKAEEQQESPVKEGENVESQSDANVNEQTTTNTATKSADVTDDVLPVRQNQVDIAKIVSKLEEAAKEQEMNNDKSIDSPTMYNKTKSYQNKAFRTSPRFRNKPNNFRKYTKSNSVLEHKINNDTDSSDGTPVKVERKDVVKTNEYQKSERNSPEKQRKHYKQSNSYQSSPKRQLSINSTNNSPVKEMRMKQNAKNYSDMVKKTYSNGPTAQITQLNGECGSPKITKPNTVLPKTTELETVKPTQKLTNQWISVSNRKKRKNTKNVEELDELPENSAVNDVEPDKEEVFESYDVNLLEDVIPPLEQSQQDDIIIVEEAEGVNQVKIVANNVEEMLTTIALEANIDLKPADDSATNINIQIPEVSDIEKELIQTSLEIASENVTPKIVEPTENKNQKSKKKAKKSTPKSAVKRVIITDVDMSECTDSISEKKATVQEIVETQNEAVKESKENPTQIVKEHVEEAVNADSVEKKSKKKKKKTTKVQLDDSLSNSETTLNANDDSYDFLLENVIFDETVEKTNVEVSQELDKMIQKGMYSSLEEKMKSMNISKNDGFFQTVLNNISTNSRENSVEKQASYIKTPDLSKLLNPLQLFKPSSVSLEENNTKINMDISKIKLPDLELPSTSKAGFFLENPEVNKILQETNNNSENNSCSKTNETETLNVNKCTEPSKNQTASKPMKSTVEYVESDTKTLYPITQAVKEWMNKTREVTPDVELLKSPNTIYKEFCASDAINSDTETISVQVTENVKLDNGKEDEVTLFSIEDISEDNLEQQDLLEYWENDLDEGPVVVKDDLKCSGAIECSKYNSNVNEEELEEMLQVYESKYGQNEDYLKLQAEISSRKTKQYTRQGSLPYSRAICCNLM